MRVRTEVEERRDRRRVAVRAFQGESHRGRYFRAQGQRNPRDARNSAAGPEPSRGNRDSLAPRRLGPLAPTKGAVTGAPIAMRAPGPDMSVCPAGCAPDDVAHGGTPQSCKRRESFVPLQPP
jgi:hypothetical protein